MSACPAVSCFALPCPGMRIIQSKERVMDCVAKWEHADEKEKAAASNYSLVFKGACVALAYAVAASHTRIHAQPSLC